MRTRSLVTAAVVASVLLTAASCNPEEFTALSNGLRKTQGVDDSLLKEARAARGLTELSEQEQATRTRLLAQLDTRLLEAATKQMDNVAVSAGARGSTAAVAVADQMIRKAVKKQFLDDLKEVTKEVLKDQACQSVLDVVAPKPVEQGVHRSGTAIVQEAIDKVVERGWKRPADADRWSDLVDWLKWQQGVGEAADQLSSSLLDGTLTINMFARPPVQRAALAYARYCYPAPRLP